MDRTYFQELTNYTLWVNTRVMEWLHPIDEAQWEQEIISSFSSIKQTVTHLVSAEKIWIDFWKKVPDPVFLSSEFKGTKEDLLQIWKQTSADLKTLMEHYPETQYRQPVTFQVRGQEWQMEFAQTFLHFINHATYHRGQLVTLLRQAGMTQLSSTDLATYYRLQQK